MIFVILGTQDKTFERLLIKIDEIVSKKIITEKVIVQAGSTKYETNNMEVLDFIPMKEFADYIKNSSYIITHGGVGSILDALKNNKKVIAVPRLEKYKEHENDHQLEIIKQFEKEGYIIACEDLNELEEKIKLLNNFVPKEYKGNNSKMISTIENYINKLK